MTVKDNQDILEQLESYVQETLAQESSGHDWWHIVRVRNLAVTIAQKEGADLFICQAAALVHDLADEKFNSNLEEGLWKVDQLLQDCGVETNQKQVILEIIATMSFKGGGDNPMTSLEGQIVQDADHLDAIGAMVLLE